METIEFNFDPNEILRPEPHEEVRAKIRIEKFGYRYVDDICDRWESLLGRIDIHVQEKLGIDLKNLKEEKIDAYHNYLDNILFGEFMGELKEIQSKVLYKLYKDENLKLGDIKEEIAQLERIYVIAMMREFVSPPYA